MLMLTNVTQFKKTKNMYATNPFFEFIKYILTVSITYNESFNIGW